MPGTVGCRVTKIKKKKKRIPSSRNGPSSKVYVLKQEQIDRGYGSSEKMSVKTDIKGPSRS